MLGKLLLPNIAGPLMGALAAVLLAGGIYHWWTVSSLERTVQAQKLSIAFAEEQLAKARANNTKLEAAIDKQNDELEALLKRVETAEAQNDKRLAEARKRWEAQWRATVPVRTAEEANQWFESQYLPP